MATFNIGDEIETVKPITVIGKGEIVPISAGKVGKVTLVDDTDICIEIFGIGRAVVKTSSIRLVEPAVTASVGNGQAGEDVELDRLRSQVEMLSHDLQIARDALMPFYNFWVKWFDSDGVLAGSPEKALDFGEWFWHNAESEDITKSYKGAVDAINKAEML